MTRSAVIEITVSKLEESVLTCAIKIQSYSLRRHDRNKHVGSVRDKTYL